MLSISIDINTVINISENSETDVVDSKPINETLPKVQPKPR